MRLFWPTLLIAGLSAPALAQLGVPVGLRGVPDRIGDTLSTIDERVQNGIGDAMARLNSLDVLAPVRSAEKLAQDRLARLDDFVRRNRSVVEADADGQPARRGLLLMLDPDPAAIDSVRAMGFTVGQSDALDNLGLTAVTLTVPDGMALRNAQAALAKAIPGKTIVADQIHFPGGGVAASPSTGAGSTGARDLAIAPIRARVGIIDGGIGGAIPLQSVRGFANGAPRPSAHGTAVASLMRHVGVGNILSADVYGSDRAGGDALAISRALDWMLGQKVPVVSISLVGPRNALLERAVAAALARGTTIVAAVGNDGPAAPPAYPASYSGVLAVTAVDGRNRALIEAGRALHLDYAAPGADMKALDVTGRWRSVRGTSFATPLVAARAAAAVDHGAQGSGAIRATLDAEARDLGARGPDAQFGRGLLCGNCRAK